MQLGIFLATLIHSSIDNSIQISMLESREGDLCSNLLRFALFNHSADLALQSAQAGSGARSIHPKLVRADFPYGVAGALPFCPKYVGQPCLRSDLVITVRLNTY